MDWTVGGTCIKSSRSVYAPHLVQSMRSHSFKYRGGDNAHWISKNKMAAMAVQWELCGMNFRENIANLWVSCYNWNNDLSAGPLIVQDPREQGEWCSQTLATLRFWLHHSPCSVGCCINNTLAARSLPPNDSVQQSQYHGCWCRGSLHCQDFSTHDIDYVEWIDACLIWEKDFNYQCHVNVEQRHKI